MADGRVGRMLPVSARSERARRLTVRTRTSPSPRAPAPDVDAMVMSTVAGLEDPFARIGLAVLRGAGLRVGELLDLEVGSVVDYGPAGTWRRHPGPRNRRPRPLHPAPMPEPPIRDRGNDAHSANRTPTSMVTKTERTTGCAFLVGMLYLSPEIPDDELLRHADPHGRRPRNVVNKSPLRRFHVRPQQHAS